MAVEIDFLWWMYIALFKMRTLISRQKSISASRQIIFFSRLLSFLIAFLSMSIDSVFNKIHTSINYRIDIRRLRKRTMIIKYKWTKHTTCLTTHLNHYISFCVMFNCRQSSHSFLFLSIILCPIYSIEPTRTSAYFACLLSSLFI
jgi:hypothetical protein